MSEKRTEISSLGEFGLIEHLSQGITKYHEETLKGIGDDAAVIKGENTNKLISSDMLLEGVHFDLSYMPLHHLGYKAAVVNISDIAAMNGIPKQLTVNIGLSNRFSMEAVDAIYQGINSACKQYKVDVVGGDTTSSTSGLVLSLTVIGEAADDKITYRNGAKNKDILCVTGDLGGAYLGLQILEREKQVFLTNPEMQPDLEKYQQVVQRQLKPEARMDIVYELKEKGIKPTSMIDLSDGLASDLSHLCSQSGLGARVFENKLPYSRGTDDAAREFNLPVTTCVLNGGEDYELLFTIDQEDHEKIEVLSDVHLIGYMEKNDSGPGLVTTNEQLVPITAQGWKHFED